MVDWAGQILSAPPPPPPATAQQPTQQPAQPGEQQSPDWTRLVIGGRSRPPPDPLEQFISGPSGGPRINPLRLPVDERGRVNDAARGAPASLIASASLLPDIQDQIIAYANGMRMDPGRFGVDRDGHIIYSDPENNGMATRVVPRGVTPAALSFAGPAITAAGGILGGATTTPVLGGVPGAAVGAFGADVTRQALGRYFNSIPDPLTGINFSHAVGEGALNAGGQAAGRGLVSLFSRNPLGVDAAERLAATDPQARASWDRIIGMSRGTHPVTGQPLPLPPGTPPVPPIDLDIAQTTGLASMRDLGRQARRWSQTTDAETARLELQQRSQVPARFRYEVDQNVGPRTSVEAAVGRNERFPGTDPATGQPLPRPGMRGAAQDIIETAEEARSASARPHYNAAYTSGVVPDVSPIVQQIDALLAPGGGVARGSATARALTEARTAMTEVVTDPQGNQIVRPAQSYRTLGDAKLVIDNILDNLSRGTNPPTPSEIAAASARLTPIQRQYTQILRDAHPEWDQGYLNYIRNSRAVTDVQRDLGSLARMGTNERMTVLDAVFSAGNMTPEQIGRMRQGFLVNGRMDEWNAGLSTWLEGRLQQALTPLQEGGPENVAGRLWKTLSTEGQRDVLRAAMPPDRARNIEALLEVFDHARRFAPIGSTTATDTPVMGTQAAGRLVNIAGRLTSPSSLFDLGNIGASVANAIRTPAMRRQLVEAFNNPDAVRALSELRMLPPGSARAVSIATQFLGDVTGEAASSQLFPPGARAPTITGPGQ